MNLVTLIFAAMTMLIHVIVFVGESVFWLEPVIYKQAVLKIGLLTEVSAHEQARILEVLFFNQGFYNLFVAIGGVAGIILYKAGKAQAGLALVSYTCFFALGAALVLASSTTAYPGALIQGVPPALALLGVYANYRISKNQVTI